VYLQHAAASRRYRIGAVSKEDRGDHPSDVLALMRDSPLVALDRLGRALPARVVAKLEMLNPGGSVKDRIGRRWWSPPSGLAG